MKVTVLLRNEHEAIKALFEKFNQGSLRTPNGKKELFDEIRREITLHSQMEQDIFYPALSETASPRAAELVARAEQEHRTVEKLLQELKAVNGSDKTFETKMTQLIEDVVRHIDMEEEEIFEEARQNFSEQRLEELGLEMEDRRKILTNIAA
jgi:iron-sulfur cluster repair protein YtfE (RIC family)